MCVGEVHIGCWQGSLRERDHLVDEGIKGKRGGGGMDWMGRAQVRDM
jgi:hypothetical protein